MTHAAKPSPSLKRSLHWMLLPVLCLLPAVAGCWSSFQEMHYFQSTDPVTGQSNYFRLRVGGYSRFSSSRYLAGYYDERAVDLFFNEIQSAGDTSLRFRPFARADLTDPGSDDKIRPLSPGSRNGTFVMLFSTNANAVADAIGQFGENQLVADAITNLVNRQTVIATRSATAAGAVVADRAAAVADELESLMQAVPDSGSATQVESALLRVLRSIARSLGNPADFPTFDEALTWFRRRGL